MRRGAQRPPMTCEVWLAGQNRFARSAPSPPALRNWQPAALTARFKEEGGKPQFLHTLNGSGLAVGRTLIAVLENGQQEDGSVTLPKALRPWIGGAELISPAGVLE